MLKIRLTQTGTKNQKKYRLIAIEEGKKRDGKAKEILGHHNPVMRPPVTQINLERVQYWLGHGAQLSDGAKKLLDSLK